MIYASNTYAAVNSTNTDTPKRNKKMLQNTSSALYCSTVIIRGKETGLGFLFQMSLNEGKRVLKLLHLQHLVDGEK